MRSGISWSRISAGLFIAVLLLAAAVLVGASRQGYNLYSVRSDSMEPVLQRGSGLVINKNDTTIQTGDVVAYISPTDPRLIITHRVVEVYPRQGFFVARGDNTSSPDSPIPIRNLIGTATFKMPLAGYGFDVVRHPVGLAVIVYVPALGIVLSEVARLKQHYATAPKRRYTLYGY